MWPLRVEKALFLCKKAVGFDSNRSDYFNLSLVSGSGT